MVSDQQISSEIAEKMPYIAKFHLIINYLNAQLGLG